MNRMTRREQRQLFGIFFKIGVTTIGGGYAMIPMMEHEIVQRMKWLDQQEFMDILAVSQATPGIFAVDMASHIGHKLGGVRMAMLAALGNVLPSFIIILILATLFQQFKEIQLVEYAFRAIRPVVVALIAAPVFSMARSASLTRYTLWIPLVSASLIYFLGVSPVYIILIAALAGWGYGLLKGKQKASRS
nr:chromate transporter [uncultured Porphyromonas sp.]